MFKPGVSADHDEYDHRILTRQCQFFGPFPISYQEIAPPSTLSMLIQVMSGLHEKQMPFTHRSTKEVSMEDNNFILKIMKLDPGDRHLTNINGSFHIFMYTFQVSLYNGRLAR